MTEREKKLKYIIKSIWFMAVRYAHGRHTFSPSTVRECYYILQDLGITIPKDPIIKPPEPDEIHGMSFREDFLDDINN